MEVREIKSYLSISQVLKYYGAILVNSSSGSWWCPIHERGGKNGGHHTPSLVAKDDIGKATCLSQGCFQNDDVLDVIAKMENYNIKTQFPNVLRKASEIAGIPATDLISNKNYLKLNYQKPVKNLEEKHLLYLESIGISRNTAHIFNLKSRYDYILYPQIKNNSILGYKGISILPNLQTGKKKIFNEGKDRKCKIWFEPIIKHQKTVIFTEGEKDCMRLNQELASLEKDQNIVAVTSSTGAQSFPKDIKEFIKKYSFEQIIIIYDNDKAGQVGSRKLMEALISVNVNIKNYSFPKEFKEGYDISDWFQDGHTFKDLLKLQYQSPPKREDIFQKIFESRIINHSFIEETLTPDINLNTGMQEIDEEAPLILGENSIITGRTGYGKTVLGVNITNGVLKHNKDVNVIFFSLELKRKALFHRLIACEYDMEQWKMKRGFIGKDGTVFIEDKQKYIDACMEYMELCNERLLIYDDLYTVEQIERELKKLEQHGFIPHYLIIDYVNIMDFEKPKENKHVEISKWIKRLAKEKNYHIQGICQANRMTVEKADGFARTENLADSDQYGRDAFTVYSIISNQEGFFINPTKNRNGKAEQVFKFGWNPVSGKIKYELYNNNTY